MLYFQPEVTNKADQMITDRRTLAVRITEEIGDDLTPTLLR